MGRRAIVLLVALVLAGLAAWAVWNYLQNVENEITEGQEIVEVFRAGEIIAEGTDGAILLSDFDSGGELIVLERRPGRGRAEGAITSAEQLEPGPHGSGVCRADLGRIHPDRSTMGVITVNVVPLAEEIPSGKQAMTISTDNVRGINGFVEPGDRVNMIITIDIPEDLLPAELSGIAEVPTAPTEGGTPAEQAQASVTYSRFVLQGLPVMATGRDIRPDEDAARECRGRP